MGKRIRGYFVDDKGKVTPCTAETPGAGNCTHSGGEHYPTRQEANRAAEGILESSSPLTSKRSKPKRGRSLAKYRRQPVGEDRWGVTRYRMPEQPSGEFDPRAFMRMRTEKGYELDSASQRKEIRAAISEAQKTGWLPSGAGISVSKYGSSGHRVRITGVPIEQIAQVVPRPAPYTYDRPDGTSVYQPTVVLNEDGRRMVARVEQIARAYERHEGSPMDDTHVSWGTALVEFVPSEEQVRDAEQKRRIAVRDSDPEHMSLRIGQSVHDVSVSRVSSKGFLSADEYREVFGNEVNGVRVVDPRDAPGGFSQWTQRMPYEEANAPGHVWFREG